MKSMQHPAPDTLDPDIGRSGIAAIPRRYNFAEDVLARNRQRGVTVVCIYRPARDLELWSACGAGRSVRQFAAEVGIQREQRI